MVSAQLLYLSCWWRRWFSQVALIALALSVVLSTVSCASKPAIEVMYAEIKGVSTTGLIVNVGVAVNNSNSFDIQIRNMRFVTTLAGTIRLPQVELQPDTWLAAKSTTYMTVPVTVPWAAIPNVMSATAANEDISYSVDGFADVIASRSMGIQANNEPISSKGFIKREMMLQAASVKLPGLK